KLQRRYAAPCIQKVSGARQLHLRRTRRMIRHNDVDGAILERVPKCFSVTAFAYRWTALELRSSLGNILRRKVQIVRAGLRSYLDAVCLRLNKVGQGICGRVMDD